MPKVIVIGGGVSGLSVAFGLLKQGGIEVWLLESEARVGGKAHTLTKDGFTLESGSNGWLDKEPAMRTLLSELDLTDRVQPSDEAAARRFIFRNGRLRELQMHPLKFMLSSALPLGARIRIAQEPFIKKPAGVDDETLAEFAARRLGKGARDFLIGPMASGVYAGDPSKMSLQSCFPKIHALEAAHGGLIRGMTALKKEKKARGENPNEVTAGPSGKLTSLKGGMSDLVAALEQALSGRIIKSCTVTAVRHTSKGFSVETAEGRIYEGDAVVSAAPAYAAATYLQGVDPVGSHAFAAIPYPALDVVCLAFRRPDVGHDLNGFGFLVPRAQGLVILGSLWSSSIFPGRAPDGYVLFRTMIGGMTDPEMAELHPDAVIEQVRDDLEKAIGLDKNTKAALVHIFRHEKAIPQYHVGHSALVEQILGAEVRLPGFFVSGNAVGGIGVIDCVRNARLTCDRIVSFLHERRS